MNFNIKSNIPKITAIFIILLLNSCENLSDPGQAINKNSIICTLTANVNKQRLYIYNVIGLEQRTHGGYVSLDDFNQFFTENALIKIESNSESFSNFFITQDTNNVKFYSNEDLNPKPGEVYNLKVKIGDDFITGKTIVPENFQIISPEDNKVISFLKNQFKINLKWENSRNIYGYIMEVSYHVNPQARYIDNFVYYSEVLFDTSYNFIGQDYKPTDTVRIRLLGFDENYYEHVFKGKESSGVEGAYGYFGSSILKTVNVIVR